MLITPLNLDSVLLFLHNSKLAYWSQSDACRSQWVSRNVKSVIFVRKANGHLVALTKVGMQWRNPRHVSKLLIRDPSLLFYFTCNGQLWSPRAHYQTASCGLADEGTQTTGREGVRSPANDGIENDITADFQRSIRWKQRKLLDAQVFIANSPPFDSIGFIPKPNTWKVKLPHILVTTFS